MSKTADDDFAVRCNAYHEAGHAVAAVVNGYRVLDVDIRPVFVHGLGNTQGSANLALPSPKEFLGKGEAVVMPILVVMFAGVFAEQRINPKAGIDFGHEQSDGKRAVKYAAGAICKPVVKNGVLVTPIEDVQKSMPLIEACIEKARLRSQDFVATHASAIEAVAEALATKRSLSPAEVDRLIGTASTK